MIVQKFKPLIAPLQLWLLSMARCVGCGKELTKSVNRVAKGSDKEVVTCDCRRVYIFEKKTKSYRRALVNEIVKA